MSHRTFDDPTSIEALQFRLDNRCENRKRKRHAVTRRGAKAKLKRKSIIAHKLALRDATAARHHARVRAFWAGEAAEHP